MAALGDLPRESYAEAVEHSLVWKLPADLFRKTLSSNPGMVIALTKQIGSRLELLSVKAGE